MVPPDSLLSKLSIQPKTTPSSTSLPLFLVLPQYHAVAVEIAYQARDGPRLPIRMMRRAIERKQFHTTPCDTSPSAAESLSVSASVRYAAPNRSTSEDTRRTRMRIFGRSERTPMRLYSPPQTRHPVSLPT